MSGEGHGSGRNIVCRRDKRFLFLAQPNGALAQLGERLICIQEVIGSIPIGSTRVFGVAPTSGLRLRHMPQEGPKDLFAGRSPDGMWVGSSGG